MKSAVKSPFHLLISSLFLPLALAAGVVVETPTEIHLTADLDGDGRADLVVIDREGGGFRAAYQTAPGVWTWSEARPTGLDGVSSAVAGRWFTTASEGFAIASPGANRVRVVRAHDPAAPAEITVITSASALGPSSVAAPDIGGVGKTAHSDLWVGFTENGAPDPFSHGTYRHDGDAFDTLATTTVFHRPEFVRTVPLREGGTPFVVFLGTLPGENALFTALDYSSGPPDVAAQTSLFENSRWTTGKLGAGPEHHLLTWQPGNLLFRARSLTEDAPNSFSVGGAEVFFVETAIGQLLVAQSDAGARLLVISPDGGEVAVYAFNGIDPPDLLQSITPAPGDRVLSALPLPDGGFQLLSGPVDGAYTQMNTHFISDAEGIFEAQSTQSLPEFRPAGLRPNVFAFTSEPLVDPNAQITASFTAVEWSSEPDLDGNELAVRRERFQGSANGLGDSEITPLGTVPVGTTFALTNQMAAHSSVHSLSPGDDAMEIDVEISPPPGHRNIAVLVHLSATSAVAPIFYRLNDGPWQNWTGTGLYIGEDTEIAFFARHPITNEPTRIRRALYTFATPPHLIDSDGDGVPDFVERFFGLDPFAGVDTDGDGFSDLNEILLYYPDTIDPNDPEKRPANNQRIEENIAFRLQAGPLPVDGSTQNRTMIFPDSRMEVHALDGTLLGGAGAGALTDPGLTDIGLSLDQVVANARLDLFTVMTEAVFPVFTPDPDKDRGRELAVFLPIPKPTLPEIEYTPGGGSLADEVAAWIAAAQAARDSMVRPLVARNFTEIDTLAALVLEWKVEEILLERGLPGLTPGRLTLFGGRPGDTGRFAPDAESLATLRLRPTPDLPAYNLGELFAAIDAEIKNEPVHTTARMVATAIYTASSANANAQPPGTYLPPFDVLRAFVRGEPLPEPYASDIPVASKAYTDSQAALLALRDGLSPRPVGTFTLLVEDDSFIGTCHGFTEIGSGITHYLFAVPGQPYIPGTGFDLIPGTEILVTGYTDLDDACGPAIELIVFTVLSFPPVAFIDTDGNLLPDDWEWAFLLGLGNDPFDDADGDGYSNLQEFLDGTDPLDGLSNSGEAFDLSPPLITLFGFGENGIALAWEYPAPYVQAFQWILEISHNLIHWDPHPNAVVTEEAPGLLVITLPDEIELNPTAFYRVRMVLKP